MESQLWHLLALWLQQMCSNSLSLGSLICKSRRVIIFPCNNWVDYTKWNNVWTMAVHQFSHCKMCWWSHHSLCFCMLSKGAEFVSIVLESPKSQSRFHPRPTPVWSSGSIRHLHVPVNPDLTWMNAPSYIIWNCRCNVV